MKLKIADDLSLPLDVTTQALAWLGRRGSGKSYGATKLAELLHASHAQFVAIDPVGIWYGLRLSADGKGDGIDVPIFGGLHGDIPLEATAGALIADVISDRGISAVLDVSQFESDADKARFARDFAARFFYRKKSSPSAVHIFIEEAQEFIPQNIQRGEEQMLHAWQRMIRLGRNYGIGVSMISQRPQDVNKKALNQAECIFCFQLTGPQERKAVEDWISDKGLSDDLGNLLPSLTLGCAHLWSPVWLDINREIHIAEKETYAAGTTPKVGAKPVSTRPLAQIELEKIKTDMAATVEKAKANDPTALKKRIAELEKSLAAKSPVGPAPDPVRVPVVTDAQVRSVEKIVGRLEVEGRKRIEAAEVLRKSGEQLALTGKDFSDALRKASAPAVRAVVARPTQSSRQIPVSQLSAEGEEKSYVVGKGEKIILNAIANFADGIDKNQLSVLAGYTRKSRDTYLSRLSGAGYIDTSTGKILITQSGVDVLGDSYKPLPAGDALRKYWMDKLKGGEKSLLELLINAHPDSVHRDELNQSSGYTPKSVDTFLSRLAAREVVTMPENKMVRASDNLFDKADTK